MKYIHEERLKEIPLRIPNADTWASNIRKLSVEELDAVGIDENGLLYWNGRSVLVQKRITLSKWQLIGAFTVGLFAVVGGVGSAAQGWSAYND